MDLQLREARGASEDPAIDQIAWESLATTIAAEVRTLNEAESNDLRIAMPVPPEKYREEIEAFQAWHAIADGARHNPVVVRALVMTELYVSFVWLRDSLISPTAEVVDDGVLKEIDRFLRGGNVRKLRNAIAHGRWTYKEDFSGLDCWDGKPSRHFSISQDDYGKWQLLSRGTAIAIILALTADAK